MKVLVGCEFSGVVREAFRKRKHDAWSCDLEPTEIEGQHIKGDVLDVIYDKWDLFIGHPPCTYLTNAGSRWLYKDGLVDWERWEQMEAGAYFFKRLLSAPIERICLENPIMHRYAIAIIKQHPTQYVQPFHFGHNYSKCTGLWLKKLPPLVSTNYLDKSHGRISFNQLYASQTSAIERRKDRSYTPIGLAEAMASQWG